MKGSWIPSMTKTSLLIKATSMNGAKKCAGCGRVLKIDGFGYKDKKKGIRQSICRECFSAYNRKRYQENKEKIRERVKSHRDNHPELELDTRLKSCAKNPSKKNAYMAVDAALRSGVLEKPEKCSGCGSRGRLSAHHYDYSKPLDVIWVCRKCHYAVDEIKRRENGINDCKKRPVVMVLDGREICAFESIADAAKAVGRDGSSIRQCLAGKSKTCAGVEWQYKKE